MRSCGVWRAPAVLCALTGKRVEDWARHSQTQDMRLFTLLKDRLTSPTEPLPARNIYTTIANPCRLVDEFMCAKTTRRLGRLRTALRFLRRHNVLLHSLLFHVKETKTWNTTAGFARMALYGESILKTEVRGRLLRLFPDIDAATFAAVSSSVVSESALCALFDSLSMKSLVGAKPDGPDRGWSLTARQRSNMLCAIVGEMSWFAARTRAMDRTHNNALFPPSDALILHVLCCHVLESIPAELLYAVIEPKVRRIKEVWVNQPMSLPEQLRLKPRTIGALSLSLQPCSITEDERARKAQASLAPVCRPLLFQERVFGSVRSTMRPRFNYKRFDGRRYQILAGDTRCDAPLMPSPRPRGSSEPVTVQMPDERRRELLQLAIDRGKR